MCLLRKITYYGEFSEFVQEKKITYNIYNYFNDFFSELLESSGVSPSLVCKTITQVLRLELTKDEVLPLLHSLIDGLTDEVTTSAKGASLVLCSLLETRGYEEDVAGIL